MFSGTSHVIVRMFNFFASGHYVLLSVSVDCYSNGLKEGSRPCLPHQRQRLMKGLVSIHAQLFIRLIRSQQISMVSNIGCPLGWCSLVYKTTGAQTQNYPKLNKTPSPEQKFVIVMYTKSNSYFDQQNIHQIQSQIFSDCQGACHVP